MTPSRTTGAFILEMGQAFSFSSRAVFSPFISLGCRTFNVLAVCVIGAMLMWEVLLEEAPECMSDFSIENAVFRRKCLGQTRALTEISTNLLRFWRERLFQFLEYSVTLKCCASFVCCCLFFRGVCV